jgi:alkanesulfonate monooxygenase SsuD/methylene tetrahydromethanopterin reductase-like flavin-dependent oxidoreductase (luciferase family)
LARTVDAARDSGFVAVSANDHFAFARPWLDGPTALASVAERCETMALATTVSLVGLRGPVVLAKALGALAVLAQGQVIAGVGPGSSRRDYELAGVPFERRWTRFDEAVVRLRALLGSPLPSATQPPASLVDTALQPQPPRPVPVWIGSWGSPAGLRRVARLADGWLASAYNTSPERFARDLTYLRGQLARRDRPTDGLAQALVTMWTWVTEDRHEAESVITDVLAPLLGRDPSTLRGRVCVGPAQMCAELLARYAEAGCRRVHFWPVADEARQVELVANRVLPLLGG